MNNPVGISLIMLVGGYLIFRGGKMALTDRDEQIDIMARTAWGEARGEGQSGMQAVLNVVMNRVKKGSWYGATPKEVCLKKYQFSCWLDSDPNKAKLLAVDESDKDFAKAKYLATLAYDGELTDITKGATNYVNLATLGNNVPDWVGKLEKSTTIGNHSFYIA